MIQLNKQFLSLDDVIKDVCHFLPYTSDLPDSLQRSHITLVIIRKPINIILKNAVGYTQYFCYKACDTKRLKQTHSMSQILAPYQYVS